MSDQELLKEIKDYIERYMFEGTKYHLSRQDHWIKQLYDIIEKQQEDIETLEESLHITRVSRRDLIEYVKQVNEENKELKEELIDAYQKRGDMYVAGEKESIDERIKELKN